MRLLILDQLGLGREWNESREIFEARDLSAIAEFRGVKGIRRDDRVQQRAQLCKLLSFERRATTLECRLSAQLSFRVTHHRGRYLRRRGLVKRDEAAADRSQRDAEEKLPA